MNNFRNNKDNSAKHGIKNHKIKRTQNNKYPGTKKAQQMRKNTSYQISL